MHGLRLTHALAAWPLVAAGCVLTSSLDELEGEPALECEGSHVDCDGIAANGCETQVDSSALHCGACGLTCPSAPSAAPACVNGSCTIACDIIAGNCDGDDANGCETPIEKDPLNCGGCGHVCGSANATSNSCEKGACVIECEPGFTSCDGLDATGCEAELTTAEQCGICSRSCLGADCTNGNCSGSVQLDHATAVAVANGVVYVATSQANCDANNNCTYLRFLRGVSSDGAITDLFEPSAAIVDIAVDASGALYLASNVLHKYDPGASDPGPTQLSPGIGLGANVREVEVDAAHAYYWADGLGSNAGLLRVPLAGGSAEQLVPITGFGWNQDSALALAGGHAYYYVSEPSQGLYSLAIPDGPPALVQAGKLRALAAHGDAVYFSLEADPSTIYRALDGEVSKLVSAQAGAEQIVADGTELWWWNRDAGSLQRAGIDGTQVTAAFTQPAAGPALLALDAKSVYWLVPSSGQLNRLAR